MERIVNVKRSLSAIKHIFELQQNCEDKMQFTTYITMPENKDFMYYPPFESEIKDLLVKFKNDKILNNELNDIISLVEQNIELYNSICHFPERKKTNIDNR